MTLTIDYPAGYWYHHECEPKRGERPRNMDRDGDPMFNIKQVVPRSGRGQQFLREMHHELRDMESNRRMDERPHRDREDALKYSIGVDWGYQDETVQMSLRRATKMSATIMNEKEILAVALLDNFTTVVCEHNSGKYTFKKPLDMELEVEDTVVVSLNNGSFRIATIEEIHDCVVNPDDIKLAWVVQKIDSKQYDQLLEMDKMAVSKIREMEKRKAKRELLAEFHEGLSSDEQKKLGSDLGIDLESK